jgi:integrase
LILLPTSPPKNYKISSAFSYNFILALTVHLLLNTGARRGEVLGLKWDKVDFQGNRIHICNNVLYSPGRGIYEDTPKTDPSDRFITLPPEIMQLLRQYRAWQSSERLRLGDTIKIKAFDLPKIAASPYTRTM